MVGAGEEWPQPLPLWAAHSSRGQNWSWASRATALPRWSAELSAVQVSPRAVFWLWVLISLKIAYPGFNLGRMGKFWVSLKTS